MFEGLEVPLSKLWLRRWRASTFTDRKFVTEEVDKASVELAATGFPPSSSSSKSSGSQSRGGFGGGCFFLGFATAAGAAGGGEGGWRGPTTMSSYGG